MKRVLKSRIFLVIVTAIICSAIGYSVYAINASEITYGNTTVEVALDDLYTEVNTPLFDKIDFSNEASIVANQTSIESGDTIITKNLSAGTYLVICSQARAWSHQNARYNTSDFYADFEVTNGSCTRIDGKRGYLSGTDFISNTNHYIILDSYMQIYKCTLNSSGTLNFKSLSGASTVSPEVAVLKTIKLD